jgi:hypothetical protein
MTTVPKYTDEEYSVLLEVLNANKLYSVFNLETAIHWLKDICILPQVVTLLNKPLERMPLFINDTLYPCKVIAIWRLKIGR